MRLSLSLATTALLSLTSAATIDKRQAVTQVYKAPSGGALENIAVRPNGQILITRFDTPELWGVDATTKVGTKLFTFSGAQAAAGITEVTPDVFAVLTGNYSRGTNKPGTWTVWKLDFTGATPTSKLVKVFADSGMFNGITTLNNDTVLIGDASKGTLVRFSMTTSESSIAIQDPTLAPPSSTGFSMGIDGVRYANGTVYFSNIFKNTFNKVKVDATGKATGAITTVLTNAQGIDDLTIGPDGNAYVALQTKGQVIKVTADGKSTTVATIQNPSAAAFGRTEKDKNVLYITTAGGALSSVPVTF